MKRNWLNFTVTAATFAFVASLVTNLMADESKDDAKKEEQRVKRRVVVIEGEPGEIDIERDFRFTFPGSKNEAKFWIGIRCEPTDDGVFVAEVVDDSPAEKAGVKKDDLILKIGEREIDEVKTLIAEIQETDGKTVKITVERKGEVVVVDVKPEARPVVEIDDDHIRSFERLLPRGLADLNATEDFDFEFMSPGIIVGGSRVEMPNNVGVTIKRQNDEPAEITIERDGKKWSVDEDSIDELPKDLRDWARQLVKSTTSRKSVPSWFRGRGNPLEGRIKRRIVLPKPSEEDDVEIRSDRHSEIDELKEQIEELREIVEELRKK